MSARRSRRMLTDVCLTAPDIREVRAVGGAYVRSGITRTEGLS